MWNIEVLSCVGLRQLLSLVGLLGSWHISTTMNWKKFKLGTNVPKWCNISHLTLCDMHACVNANGKMYVYR